MTEISEQPDFTDLIEETIVVTPGSTDKMRIGLYSESDLERIDCFGENEVSPLDESQDYQGNLIRPMFKNKSFFMLKSKVPKILFRRDDLDIQKKNSKGEELPFGFPKCWFSFIQYRLGDSVGRQKLAILPEWGNDLGRVTILILPPELIFYEGQCAPQSGESWLKGGARQVYIPKYAQEDLQKFTIEFLQKLHMLDYFLKPQPNKEWKYDFIEKLDNLLANDNVLSDKYYQLIANHINNQKQILQQWYAHREGMKRAKQIADPECFGAQGAPVGSSDYKNRCPENVRKLLESGRNRALLIKKCSFTVKTPVGVATSSIKISHPYEVSTTSQGHYIFGG